MTPTRYTVTSTDAADNQLSSLWVNYPAEHAGITRASNQIDVLLRHDADQRGQSAPEPGAPTRRYIDVFPIRVVFDVSEPDRLVQIVAYHHLIPSP
jgi:hypothetical protein